MQNITRIALGLGAAAVVASGGSAFTASSDVTAVNADHVGYGSVNVTGVTISNVAYNVRSTDASLLADIVFTATEDVSGTGYKAVLTINGSTTAQVTCSRTFTTSTAIDCDVPTQTVAGVTSVQLAVTPV